MRDWSEVMIQTPKQMWCLLGICKWYLIYIPNYASLLAPLMDSLAGKYKYDPEKHTSKVSAHKQTISLTDLMRVIFEEIKPSLCQACSLYIPSEQGEFAIHTDVSDHGSGAVLEKKDDQGNWCPCAFFSRRLQGSVLGNLGQRAWSVREKGTYALVSCLLNLICGYQGARSLFSLTISSWSHGTKKSFVPWLIHGDDAAVCTNSSASITL